MRNLKRVLGGRWLVYDQPNLI